jgi:hypothetical protein
MAVVSPEAFDEIICYAKFTGAGWDRSPSSMMERVTRRNALGVLQ